MNSPRIAVGVAVTVGDGFGFGFGVGVGGESPGLLPGWHFG